MKLTINIDASSLSESSCILRMRRVVVEGYRTKLSSASMVYGSAVHKFIDTMFKTSGNMPESFKAMSEVFNRPKLNEKASHLLDERHLQTTCITYWHHLRNDTDFQVLALPDGKPATEITFSLPYYEDDNFIVNLCGTIDTIGAIRGGCYCIRDFKTSSVWDVKGYLSSYSMSRQLRFYALALRIMYERFPESLLGRIGGSTVIGARIDGIFLKPDARENKYENSQVFQYRDADIVQFRSMLDKYIPRLLESIRTTDNPEPEGILNGSCDTKYKCKFWTVCCAPAEIREVIFERDFRKVPYNPLAFSETL